MKHPKYVFIILVLLAINFSFAQQTNEFLSRAYWKTNPSIAEIDQKIAQGNDISELDRNMFDPVAMALIEKVDNKTIKYMLSKKGNNVNKLTHDGRTYIFWAAYKNNLELMQFLVDKGAKTDVIDSHGYSVANFAAVTGQTNTKLYDFCVSHGADLQKDTNHSGANALLLVAPFAKDMKIINYFVDKGISLHTKDANGNGIFHYAAKSGNIPLMEQLLKNGVDYKKLSDQGENAIIFASRGLRRKTNSLETFQYLASLGINPNITTLSGETPLHALAAKSNDLEIFKYFVNEGVSVDQPNEEGNTALINAAYSNDEKIVRYLLSQSDDINHQNKQGRTALTNAVYRNSPEVVALLLQKGADINVLDKEKNNLSYYLIKSFNAKDQTYFNQKLVLLQSKVFNFLQPQANGNTLYHIALENPDLEVLQYIQSATDVDINQRNEEGIAPLHIAAMKAKDTEILQYLLSIGADKTIKTAFDESAYDLAKENEILQSKNININFLK